MFCNKCGNEMPDGSVFCSRCGNSLNSNINPPRPFMTKKEYLETSCSEKARTIMKAGKIVLLACSILILITTVISFLEMNAIFEELDFDGGVKAVFERIQELSGENLGITEADYAEMELFEQELGISIVDLVKIFTYSILVFRVIALMIVIILSLFTVKNNGLATAIIALVLSVLFSGSIYAIGMTITLLVFVCILNKEYKQYCNNSYYFASYNQPYNNDFSN